jgi:hypothetical protein
MKTWARPPPRCGVGYHLFGEPGNGKGAGAGVWRGQGYGVAALGEFEIERTGDGWGDGRGHSAAGFPPQWLVVGDHLVNLAVEVLV